MKKNLKKLCIIAAAVILMTSVTACKSQSSSNASSASEKIIKVAFATNGYPIEYMDKNNNPSGCDIDTMKEVDKMLPGYKFEYFQADQDAVYSGLQTGTYDVALSNAFYTEERAKKYILPSNPIGASTIGIIVNKSNPGIKTIENCAKKGLTVAPTVAGDGLWYVLYNYNKENPKSAINIQVTNSISAFSDTVSWVAEGRCGFGIWPKYYWSSMVEDSKGGLHEYYSKVYFSECLSTKTYAVVRTGDSAFAKQLNTALGKLYDNGTLRANSKKWYGYDTFSYLKDK